MAQAVTDRFPRQGAGNHYQRVQIQTADSLELVLILYREALHCLELAKEHFSAGDIPQRFAAIDRAMAMISELQASLDLEKGKEIATSLDRLYSYLLHRLTEANTQKDPQPVEEVIKLLKKLYSAWQEVSLKETAGANETETDHG